MWAIFTNEKIITARFPTLNRQRGSVRYNKIIKIKQSLSAVSFILEMLKT